MPPKNSEVERLVNESQGLRGAARDMEAVLNRFNATIRRGLLQASIQGLVMVTIGVFLGIVMLTYVGGKRYLCEPENLTTQLHSIHNHVCTVIFPTTKSQEHLLVTQRKAAKANAEQVARQNQIIDRLNRFLDQQKVP